jgi:hypothetical protein
MQLHNSGRLEALLRNCLFWLAIGAGFALALNMYVDMIAGK